MTAQVSDGRLLPELVRELDDRGIVLAEFALRKASLDEVFLALTGHTAEETEDNKQVPELNGSVR